MCVFCGVWGVVTIVWVFCGVWGVGCCDNCVGVLEIRELVFTVWIRKAN